MTVFNQWHFLVLCLDPLLTWTNSTWSVYLFNDYKGTDHKLELIKWGGHIWWDHEEEDIIAEIGSENEEEYEEH